MADKKDESAKRCGQRTGRHKVFTCLKPFAETVEGQPMCRFHAAMRKRMRAADQARRNADDQHALKVKEWQRRMSATAKALQISARLDMMGLNYTDRVSVSLEDFEMLAQRKGKP